MGIKWNTVLRMDRGKRKDSQRKRNEEVNEKEMEIRKEGTRNVKHRFTGFGTMRHDVALSAGIPFTLSFKTA